MKQLSLADIRRGDCPFHYRLEDDDFHCNAAGMNALGYDVTGEDSDDFALRLAEVNGVDFDDINITNPVNPTLPRYIPTIPKGSGKLFRSYAPEFVAVGLKDVVSAKELKVVTDIHKKLGVSKKTKVIFLGFGKDRLLELVWSPVERRRIFAEIAQLDFYAVIPPNYSIWDDQPHAERLINEKRSMIAYKELSELGAQVVPHVYWCGRKDLDEYIKFFDRHPDIKTFAIDMQTLGRQPDWQQAMADLGYFASKIGNDMRCVIVGPTTPLRINQIIRTLPGVTIVNSAAAQGAVRRRILRDDLTKDLLLDIEKTDLMRANDVAMASVINDAFDDGLESAATGVVPRLKLAKKMIVPVTLSS